jgi:hypothetical protein
MCRSKTVSPTTNIYASTLTTLCKWPLLFDSLKDKYGYNLAGVGEPSYHLGGNFKRDDDGTLAWGAQAYIKKMISNYTQLFEATPKVYSSPMEEGDHP